MGSNPTPSARTQKGHPDGTRERGNGSYDLIENGRAYYRLRPKDRVKTLPESARVAFEEIPGAMPEVNYSVGTARFRSVTWVRDRWGYADPVYTDRAPGDVLIEDLRTGRTWIAEAGSPEIPEIPEE